MASHTASGLAWLHSVRVRKIHGDAMVLPMGVRTPKVKLRGSLLFPLLPVVCKVLVWFCSIQEGTRKEGEAAALNLEQLAFWLPAAMQMDLLLICFSDIALILLHPLHAYSTLKFFRI